MIIYWSMILWVILICLVYSASNKEEIMLADYNLSQGIQKRVPWVYAIIVFGYFIFWIGMRTQIADTVTYTMMFNMISDNFSEAWSQIDWDGKNPGFDIFNIIFKCFVSDNYHWWLMAIAIISGVCLMITLRKYSVNFFISAYLFMTLITFQWMVNGMRQFICVAILFLCCDWIKDGKFARYTIAVLVLSTFHLTALLMIPIYFIARGEPWSKKIGLFLIAIILICIFSEPFFSGVDSALDNTAYAGATSQFDEDDGVNPLRAVFYAIPPIIAFLKRERLKEHYEKFPMLPICINMSLVAASLYFVAMFTSGILVGRLPVYCDVYNLILIPYLFKFAFDNSQRKFVQPIYLGLTLAFFCLAGQMDYCSDITGYLA